MTERFRDRSEAGRALAQELEDLAEHPEVVVLALPRGGVPVAYEIAVALAAPLDVMVVRKLGVPGREELAMGAIASGGVRFLNEDVVTAFGISEETLEAVTARELAELERRERAYRGNRPPVAVSGKHVVLIDDGVATGATMHAAVAALKQRAPANLTVAVPTGAHDACQSLRCEVDRLVCLLEPEQFFAVGAWYAHFPQNTDEEVRTFLERANRGRRPRITQPRA